MRSASSSLLLRLAVLFAAICLAGCAETDGISAGPSAKGPAARGDSPRLLDLDGAPFDLWRASRPATVAIFIRSDCPISNRYAPEIRRLYERFHPRGVEFFLVYVNPREEPAAIRKHREEYDYPCPALRDPAHALVGLTGATVTPEAVVFDAARQTVYRGRIDDLYESLGKSRTAPTTHDLADALEATLLGMPVAVPVTKAVGCYIGDLE
jgi:hypothetical protein